MIATTIEQSKRLLKLGLDVSTADMRLCKSTQGSWFLCAYVPSEYDAHTAPAWSLSALLRVLPLGTELYKMRNDAHEIYYEIDCADATGWVGYEDSDPITAAYEMVCWLLEQGLIKKGGEE